MSTDEQRRALADTTPTTEVIRDAVTFPRDRLGEPLDISPERFDAWLAAEVRKAKAEALREYADALEAVPDHAPTEYDRGRVDQRHMAAAELYDRATEYETGDQR